MNGSFEHYLNIRVSRGRNQIHYTINLLPLFDDMSKFISICILLCIRGWAKFIYMLIMLNFENGPIDDCAILWTVKRIINNYDKSGQ